MTSPHLPITLVLAGALGLAAGGCQSQRTFSSPEEAASALAAAAENENTSELRAIFGPRANELRSGDPDADRVDIASFRRQIAQSRSIELDGDDVAIINIGADQWPFAVPVVKQVDGAWIFDTDAGIEEIENRRIGRNELTVISACIAVFVAQDEYRSMDRDGDGVFEYADRLLSTPGTRDGLYWESPGGLDPSPIGPALAMASVRTDDKGERIPYAGYRFRLLECQGPSAPGGMRDYRDNGNLVNGWAVLAWPDQWDRTGVKSFLVSAHGVMYEADLGPDTSQVVTAFTCFDPSDEWTVVNLSED